MADLLQPGWRQHYVPIGDIRLHVVEAGPADGPAVILLHGFPEFWWAWRHQIDPLAESGLRVIVPDMRGYGRSDAPAGLAAYRVDRLVDDLAGLADALKIASFHLVGHDWGGLVGWHAAQLLRLRIERLVIMDAPHPSAWRRFMLRHPAQLGRSLYMVAFQLPRLPEALLRARNFALLRATMEASARPGLFTPELLDRYADMWRRPGALTAMLNYYRALRLLGARQAERIGLPTLILWGTCDTFLDNRLAEDSAAMCDDAHVVLVQGATHWLHHEEPARITSELVDFLQMGGT